MLLTVGKLKTLNYATPRKLQVRLHISGIVSFPLYKIKATSA